MNPIPRFENNMMNNQMMNNLDTASLNIEIINHLREQNLYMQNQIEINNRLIEKLMQNISKKKDDLFPGNTGPRIDIIFAASSGLNLIIATPLNIRICDLLSAYVKKLNLSENLIGKELIFLFNGGQLKKDEQKTVSEFGFKNHSTITVLDRGNILENFKNI